MKHPTFLCIGVQKGGTTSLINYLSQHSDIFIKKNEMHFFDKKSGEITEEEIKNYEKSFIMKKMITGEKTPSYSYLFFALDRIYDYNPDIKLILLLREPIQRAYSNYNMYLQHNNKLLKDMSDFQIMKDFEEEENIKLSEISENKQNYFIVRGKYDEIINYIFSKFQKKNVYIGISEEIKLNKQIQYNKIFDFLGLKNITINEDCDTHIRKYDKPIPKILEKKLYNIYKPHNERLYCILGRKIEIWEKYYNNLSE
jgi:hypothetical protein